MPIYHQIHCPIPIKLSDNTSQSFTLATSAQQRYNEIYILAFGCNNPGVVTATFSYSTGSSTSTTFQPQDWASGTTTTSTNDYGVLGNYNVLYFANSDQNITGAVRTEVQNKVKFYEYRLLPDSTRKLTSINFTKANSSSSGSGGGQVNIFALTGILAYTISGTVYSDSLNDSIANGIASNAAAGYAVLTYNNTVISTTAIASNGTYTFSQVKALAGASDQYKVVLSTSNLSVGSSVTQSSLASGWYDNTSGTVSQINAIQTVALNSASASDKLNINFSTHQSPSTDTKTYNIPYPVASGTSIIMSLDVSSGSTTYNLGQLTGVTAYPSTGTVLNGNASNRTVTIVTLPTNGRLVYGGTPITSSNTVISNYDKTKLAFEFTGSSYKTTSFTYNFKDALNFASASNATYTVNFAYALPVKYTIPLSGLYQQDGSIRLNWTTGSETNNQYFQVQRSTNSADWTTLDNVPSYYKNGTGNGSAYIFTDKNPFAGHNYYRLNQVDLDGNAELSTVADILAPATLSTIKVYPNPASDIVNISGLPANASSITIYSIDGKMITQKSVNANTVSISLLGLASATYVLKISDKTGNKITSVMLVKK